MIAAALATIALAAPAPVTVMEWPSNTCPMADLELDQEPTEIGSDVYDPNAPMIEILTDGEDVVDAFDPPDEPSWVVLPWRYAVYADGTTALWHDERCVPDGYMFELGDPAGTVP